MVSHHLFCPIHATLPNVVCNYSWKHTPGSCSSLHLSVTLNSTILTYKYLQTALHRTAQYTAKKKKIIFFAFCFSNMPNLFPSPHLFTTHLCCLCHSAIHPRVPIISASFEIVRPLFTTFLDQLIPQLLALHNSHFVINGQWCLFQSIPHRIAFLRRN